MPAILFARRAEIGRGIVTVRGGGEAVFTR